MLLSFCLSWLFTIFFVFLHLTALTYCGIMYICESGDSYRTVPCVCLLTRSVCSLAALTASAWRSVLHEALQASSSLLRLKMASVSHLRSQSWATDACSKTTTELEHGSRFACLQTCLQSSELKTVRYDLIPERCSVCQLLQSLCILMAWTSPTESRPLIRLKGLSCGVKRLAVTPSLSVYEFLRLYRLFTVFLLASGTLSDSYSHISCYNSFWSLFWRRKTTKNPGKNAS